MPFPSICPRRRSARRRRTRAVCRFHVRRRPKSASASQPEIRPEVVAGGLALAADPSYPSADLLKRVAGAILNSPDLSDDES